jgi:hypothetical protein
MKYKNAVMGEGMLMIYRLVLIAFIAFIILGISSVFYYHYINVRDAEAKILTKEIVDCLTQKNFNIEIESEKILDYCGFEQNEMSRFFIKINPLVFLPNQSFISACFLKPFFL